MRVNNQSVDAVATTTRATTTQKVGAQSSAATSDVSSTATGSDQASLSSASNLVALAKSSTSSARQAKISALTQQVQAGSYHGSTAQAGKAMVSELLQKSTSAA